MVEPPFYSHASFYLSLLVPATPVPSFVSLRSSILSRMREHFFNCKRKGLRLRIIATLLSQVAAVAFTPNEPCKRRATWSSLPAACFAFRWRWFRAPLRGRGGGRRGARANTAFCQNGFDVVVLWEVELRAEERMGVKIVCVFGRRDWLRCRGG